VGAVFLLSVISVILTFLHCFESFVEVVEVAGEPRVAAGLAADFLVGEEWVAVRICGLDWLKEDSFEARLHDGEEPVIRVELRSSADLAKKWRSLHQFTSLSFGREQRIAISMAACAGSIFLRMAFATGIGTP